MPEPPVEELTPAPPDPAEAGLARLFEQHYASMLRLAVLLDADDPENVVAAYYQIYRKWRRLRDTEAAEAYLRSTVCNLTRMRIRHLQVARIHVENPPEETVVSAESAALLRDDLRVLIDALQQLPARQREALVVRHWLGPRCKGDVDWDAVLSSGPRWFHTRRHLRRSVGHHRGRRTTAGRLPRPWSPVPGRSPGLRGARYDVARGSGRVFRTATPYIISVTLGMRTAKQVGRNVELHRQHIPEGLRDDLRPQGLVRSDVPVANGPGRSARCL